MISFHNGDSVDDFTLRLTNLVTNLATLGAPIDETQVVEKFLWVVPPRLSQIALAIETLLDTSEMSLEEVTGRLKAAEDRLESPEPLREQGKRGAVARKDEGAPRRQLLQACTWQRTAATTTTT